MTIKHTLVGLVAIAAAGALGTPSAIAADSIKIGMSIPVSGGVAALGQHEKWGAEHAIAEINGAGGLLGRQLELVVQDNQCNPSQGVTSIESLLQDEVSAIIGCLCSSVSLAAMPIVARAETPLVVGVSTSKKITELAGVGGNEWTFRINPSDAGLAVALGNYLGDKGGIKTVAFVGEDTDYGRGGHAAVEAALKSRGIKVTSADFYQQNTPDFTTVLTRIRSEDPDAIALYAVGADEINFLRQFRSMGLKSHLTGRVALDELQDTLVKQGMLDGTTSVFPYAAGLDTPENKAFVDSFKAKFGELPNYQSFEGYEALKVIADAIKRAGSAAPGDVREAIESTSLPSLTGRVIEFDANNQAHNSAIILRVDGTDIVVETTAGT